MTILFEKTYPQTLTGLLERFVNSSDRGITLEAWLFDDAADRRKTEAEFAARGIKTRLRSAYKPLLHFFLEDLDLLDASITEVKVLYPVSTNAPENRFLLETYPLAALFGDIRFTFAPGRRNECVYDLILGNARGEESRHQIVAPNRIHQDSVGESHLSPTGWLRVGDSSGTMLHDERLATDFEALFTDTLQTLAGHPWGDKEPYFEELNIAVNLPGVDTALGYGQEVLSLHEALHEDLYFSLLEIFQLRSGRPLGDRGLQPGQIVPEIRHGDGPARVVVKLRPLTLGEVVGKDQELANAASPLTSAQIHAELGKIDGEPFTATSRAGRIVAARYHPGSDFPVMISGGQHANETSGVVGALRAAEILAKRAGSHFTVAPLENPDGYALHQRLIHDNPSHMHHAARYTALGDDLGHRRNNLYEREIRSQALQLSRAQLHINLHGYPSHEWTRPLSGYVPRGFAMWTLPKGFFLIMNYHHSWAERAEIFLAQLTERLAKVPGLLTCNRQQMDLYKLHSGSSGFRIIGGFPCMLTADDEQDVPLALTTEYPDETCHGAPFIAGHDVQTAAVLAAYDAYQNLMRRTFTGEGDDHCPLTP